MATGIESDRALGPIVRRMRRWVHNVVTRVGDGIAPEDRRKLDPLTVNYAAWRTTRRHVREWPGYRETPNHLEVLVSPEDWEDYWGVDTERKERAVSDYVTARAAEKGYWVAGKPEVCVVADDAMAIGEVEVECQFVAAADGAPPRPAARLGKPSVGRDTERRPDSRETPLTDDFATSAEEPSAGVTVRFVDARDAGEVLLLAEDGSRITARSGDCVGAVMGEDEVPDEVSIRLHAGAYPYAEVKHFSLGVIGGRWCIVNHATTGTKLLLRDGGRLMLHEPEPYPLSAGDVVYLGPCGPLRFEFA